MTRWCCCAAVTIGIAAVPWRRVESGFPPSRTFRRRRRRRGFRPCCPTYTGRWSRSRWSRWRRRTRGSRRGCRWRLFHFFKIGGGSPARGRVVEALSKPPSCNIVSLHRSGLRACERGVPLFSFCVTSIISSFLRLSSPLVCPAKSYIALN